MSTPDQLTTPAHPPLVSPDLVRSCLPIDTLDELVSFWYHCGQTLDGHDPRDDGEYTTQHLGCGSSAVILEHPHDPDLVVRISEERDGWIPYAMSEPSPFKPRVFGLSWYRDAWIVITERLEQMPRTDAKLVADGLTDVINGIDSVERAIMESLYPGVSEFILTVPVPDDIAPRNLMMRGDQLVINDPTTHAPMKLVLALREEHRVEDEEEMEFTP